jgi:hypothetical protein
MCISYFSRVFVEDVFHFDEYLSDCIQGIFQKCVHVSSCNVVKSILSKRKFGMSGQFSVKFSNMKFQESQQTVF